MAVPLSGDRAPREPQDRASPPLHSWGLPFWASWAWQDPWDPVSQTEGSLSLDEVGVLNTRALPFPGKWLPSVNCFRHPWGAHPPHSFPSYPMS